MHRNLIIICHNYHPEETSTGLYTTMMAEFLAKNNWNVTMVTGFPHYPQWKIDPRYKDKPKFYTEQINGVHVVRYKLFVPEKPTFSNRIVQLIDFAFGSYKNLKRVKEADVVISIIPFTSSAWLGGKFAKKLNARHWIHIQDFEFDAAKESGMLGGSAFGTYFSRLLSAIERRTLNAADIVSTISEGMMKKLNNRTSAKTFLFPNWIDPLFIDPSKISMHRYFDKDKFSILYSGNIGKKQDWDLFLSLAKKMDGYENIEWIVVGDGAERSNLEKKVQELKKVKIFNPVPSEELNDLLCSADLHILLQKNNVVDTVMPSKLLGMLASEVPCLVTGNLESEVAKKFSQFDLGYYYESEDLKGMKTCVLNLWQNDTTDKGKGKNARKYILETFSTDMVLQRFLSKIESVHEH